MEIVSINKSIRLSEHFSLGEVTKSSHTEIYNIPSHVAIENLKRVCIWLEALRARYNQRYVSPPKFLAEPSGKAERGGVLCRAKRQSRARGGLNSGIYSAPSCVPSVASDQRSSADHPAHPGSPPDSGGDDVTVEPIIINSGYRSPELNKKVGGAPNSNHLTGCAVDIHVAGIEQAMRYAVILMDYADETKQDYDELLIERSPHGNYWVHFAVRPKENRRKTRFLP